MVYVYTLLSRIDEKRYYVGVTENLEERLKEHNQRKVNYSKRYAPWKVETYTVFENKELAYKFEKYLKSGSGHAFLKKHLLP